MPRPRSDRQGSTPEHGAAYVICVVCGRAAPAAPRRSSLTFCPLCGARLIRLCPTCGQAIQSPHAPTCGHCGSHLDRRRRAVSGADSVHCTCA